MDPISPVMSLEEVASRDEFLRALFDTLIAGQDYDPGGKEGLFGSDRPSLLQPGAEKLAAVFGLGLRSFVSHRVEDFTGALHGEPLVTYEVTTEALRADGGLVCTGLGVCTSAEPAFRWRWVGVHDVPPGLDIEHAQVQRGSRTEFAFAIEKGETTGQYGKPAEYWEEFRAAIADGTAIEGTKETRGGKVYPAWTIETALVRITNPDMAIAANAILKRAKKRALVAAVITAIGGLSAIFTQDMEEDSRPARPRHGGGAGSVGDQLLRDLDRKHDPDGVVRHSEAPLSRAAEEASDRLADDDIIEWNGDPAPDIPVTVAGPTSPTWHAKPRIEAMRDVDELAGPTGVMALIQEQLRNNVFHRNQAWMLALTQGTGLARDGRDVDAVAVAFGKVERLLSPQQRKTVQAAIGGAEEFVRNAAIISPEEIAPAVAASLADNQWEK